MPIQQERDQVVALTIRFSSSVYNIDTIKKAAYRFTDRCSFDLSREGEDVLCRLVLKPDVAITDQSALVAEFKNEVLDQDLRRSIADETAPVRNAILAYAFSKTGLQDSE